MQTDDCGFAVHPAAAADWRAAHRGFMAHGSDTAPRLAAALAAAPDFALGHAAQGLFLSLLGRRELSPAIDAAHAAAKALQEGGGGDARSALMIAALEDYRAGRMRRAATRLEQWLAANPSDSLAFKIAHGIRFLLGDAAGLRAGVEVAARGISADHPHHGYLLGATAFALEETGSYAAAEAAGRAGVAIAPDDAWGLHAVAHVMDMTGRADDGVRWLARRAASWAHCNNFGYHVWWHLALFHIDRGAHGPALELYDRRVRPAPTDDWRDVANGASLLLRLEIEGVAIGDRWEELADIAGRRTDDGQVIFADLHYLTALDAAGRHGESAALTAMIARDAANFDHDRHEACALAGLPAAVGLTAFRAGRAEEAYRGLATALPQLYRIGGSHAQRDVFERLMIEAALRAGLCTEARAALDARAARRGARDGYDARRRAALAARAAADARPARIASMAAAGQAAL
ncbi:MAG: hypothetical protein ACI9ZH_000875 [Paracoccaceae bacterium]|jgi:hypothetical protein